MDGRNSWKKNDWKCLFKNNQGDENKEYFLSSKIQQENLIHQKFVKYYKFLGNHKDALKIYQIFCLFCV